MNFKTLLLTVGLLAPMTLASVEDDIRSDFNGACRDLMNDLVKMDIPYLEGVTSCGVDQAGEIYELKMNNLYLDESIVNKIFSDHKEIKYLEYNYINNSENIKVKNIPKSISSLKYLKGLTISFSRENNNLPEGLLKPLKDLRGLELNNVKLNSNTIKEISELSNLTKLTLLECEQNNLDFDRLNSLEKIEELSLNGINLKEYPKFIFSLPKIETLDLSENKLTYISDKLSKFKNLVKLNLSNNEINDEIPQSLNSLSHLEDVNFENNIKIKGKMLTNDSLKSCQYYAPEDEDDNTEYPYLCMPKEMKCINTTNHCRYEKHCYLGIEKPETLGCYLACKQQHFKLCSSSTKTTITKTSTKKSSTKKSSTKKSSTKKSSTKKSSTKKSSTKKSSTKKSSTKKSSTKKSSTKSSYPTSTNGKCGKDYGKCPSGTCCSKWGYCGKTESHCGSGCQSEFGKCN